MAGRQFGLYFAWSRPAEIGAVLGKLDNRFPSLFEFRRILWPEFEKLADPARFWRRVATDSGNQAKLQSSAAGPPERRRGVDVNLRSRKAVRGCRWATGPSRVRRCCCRPLRFLDDGPKIRRCGSHAVNRIIT